MIPDSYFYILKDFSLFLKSALLFLKSVKLNLVVIFLFLPFF
jgi:hypothetical protein